MKKSTILEKIKSWLSSIGWKLFIWGLDISPETYWHNIYLQEHSSLILIHGRRVGNSTRLIDFYIQLLFRRGEVMVSDHYPTRRATDRIYKTILERLKCEHGLNKDDLILSRNPYSIALSEKYKKRLCQTIS